MSINKEDVSTTKDERIVLIRDLRQNYFHANSGRKTTAVRRYGILQLRILKSYLLKNDFYGEAFRHKHSRNLIAWRVLLETPRLMTTWKDYLYCDKCDFETKLSNCLGKPFNVRNVNTGDQARKVLRFMLWTSMRKYLLNVVIVIIEY